MNEIYLKGLVSKNSERVSLKYYKGTWYRTFLKVSRKSGAFDVLPFVSRFQFSAGNPVAFTGKLISQFVSDPDHSNRLHLVVEAMAESFLPYDELKDGTNKVILEGAIRRKDPIRSTPAGREIIDFKFSPFDGSNFTGYFPAIAWERTAEEISMLDTCDDDRYMLWARFQSRQYQKQLKNETLTKTAYELSVYKFEEAEEIDEVENYEELA